MADRWRLKHPGPALDNDSVTRQALWEGNGCSACGKAWLFHLQKIHVLQGIGPWKNSESRVYWQPLFAASSGQTQPLVLESGGIKQFIRSRPPWCLLLQRNASDQGHPFPSMLHGVSDHGYPSQGTRHSLYQFKGNDSKPHACTAPKAGTSGHTCILYAAGSNCIYLFLMGFFSYQRHGDTRLTCFTHKTSSMAQYPSHVQGCSSVAVAVLRDPFLLEHFFAFGGRIHKAAFAVVPNPVC